MAIDRNQNQPKPKKEKESSGRQHIKNTSKMPPDNNSGNGTDAAVVVLSCRPFRRYRYKTSVLVLLAFGLDLLFLLAVVVQLRPYRIDRALQTGWDGTTTTTTGGIGGGTTGTATATESRRRVPPGPSSWITPMTMTSRSLRPNRSFRNNNNNNHDAMVNRGVKLS